MFWGWYRAADELRLEAERPLNVSVRELACTLLLAVVDESDSAFVQIGDGAIVRMDGGEYRPVFWPQSGEYANTTHFVTEADFAHHLKVFLRPADRDGFNELALLTDGLQRLALDYDARIGHGPFFFPLFQTLRRATDAMELGQPLRLFLDSPLINDRSDDDKTLILATRVPTIADPTDAG